TKPSQPKPESTTPHPAQHRIKHSASFGNLRASSSVASSAAALVGEAVSTATNEPSQQAIFEKGDFFTSL
ncbi:hypothetical protein, partial [Mycoplana sp. MJR14]|uniref:hypothetical protein n=1 Tax=Mycoplana sp. MJR14 TaxID=3032583 RepID=UPI0023D9FB2D